jgi:cytochrome c peroxidase
MAAVTNQHMRSSPIVPMPESLRRLFLMLAAVAAILLSLDMPSHAQGRRKRQESADLSPLPSVPDQIDPVAARKSELGRLLFFDPRLSGDNTISCATCHMPEWAFADGLPVGRGRDGVLLARNTPTLLNVGLQTTFFRDGRATSLEEQAVGPIQAADEMHRDLEELEAELQSVPEYRQQFQEAFGRPVDSEAIAESLSAFERTLVSRDSPFDRYLAGDTTALSEAARRGLELFRGDAGCIRCHHGPLLSDGKFYRLGVSFTDRGRGAVTDNAEDLAKFRTPSLRDVARTAPYMHNGSLKTLSDVVKFYYRSVPQHGPDGLTVDVQALSGRSYSEIPDIAAFLESLTGETAAVAPPTLP